MDPFHLPGRLTGCEAAIRPNIDHHLPTVGEARREGPGEGMYITALRVLMYAENEREKFSGYAENFFTHVHFRSSPIENFISPVNWSLIHHRSHGPPTTPLARPLPA